MNFLVPADRRRRLGKQASRFSFWSNGPLSPSWLMNEGGLFVITEDACCRCLAARHAASHADLTEDYRLHAPGVPVPLNRETMKQVVAMYGASFPD